MCDFETTVYENQTTTEVWASACVPLYSEEVKIFHSIDEQFCYFKSLKCNICAYYHNLKFDGQFWLYYLINNLKFKQAYEELNEEGTEVKFYHDKDMKNKTFKYVISERGQWYSITIKVGGYIIEIRDSLKLLPFSVKRIGESFNTKHKKLEMEYKGFRYAGCTITPEEEEYIKNDVLVVKEALEFMHNEGHNKLTIGSCCLNEYKTLLGKYDYELFYPDLTEIKLDNIDGYTTADEYIRKSYKGGWCYLVKGKENQLKYNGVTADVNSLYPSMMSSESGNRYPVGKPYFWKGNYIPQKALHESKYYFVRIKTRFYLKKDYLPFIQIKGSYMYKGTECLESSDYYDAKTNKYYSHYYDRVGVLHDTRVELILTRTDFELMKDHYDLVDFEILDGCWFYTNIGIFDDYINKYKKIKTESKGAKRELAKLFLNNLYGKMASNTNSSFKVAFQKENNEIGYFFVAANEKKAGYIAVGSAITSYARNFTIRAAQQNYYGKDKPGFIYADTDSIHCDLSHDKIKGIKVHEKNFCCWKLESVWDSAIFVRQKTYIEHVTHEDLKEVEKPYYNVKCAGMPQRCKDLFISSLEGVQFSKDEINSMSIEDKKFLIDDNANTIKRDLTDFKVGLKIYGKLIPKAIPGGVLLVETTYEMR